MTNSVDIMKAADTEPTTLLVGILCSTGFSYHQDFPHICISCALPCALGNDEMQLPP
jgi:hypothetical protein